MATTTNFGWETPDNTDLVKDGALAIRTLGSAIDTSLVDLKGGTTGQVLSKASNTDMDFTWIAVDPLTILDAKGDLISATAADTPARLAVGTNGQVLSANSATATGLQWITPAAGDGGYTSLATGTVSGTSVNLTSIAGTYRDLVVVMRNVSWTGADRFRFLLNNVSTGGAYTYIRTRNTSSSAVVSAVDHQINQIYSDNSDASDQDSACIFRVYDYANTIANKLYTMINFANVEGNTFLRVENIFGVFDSTSAITQINLQSATGFSAGTYQLFGVK